MIYIISRGRPQNVQKLVKRWGAMGFGTGGERGDLTVVIHDDDPWHDEYVRILDGRATAIYNRYKGAVGARISAVEHAKSLGHKSIVMSDDDISPAGGAEAGVAYSELLRLAEHENALGIGVYVDYHSFAMRGLLDKLGLPPQQAGVYSGHDRVCAVGDEAFICPSGIAFRLFAMNITNSTKICDGQAFDRELWCTNDDGEFMRKGIAQLGIPWLLYPQAKAGSMQARYASGGVMDLLGGGSSDSAAFTKHAEIQRLWGMLHLRWPKYVNPPSEDKGLRTSWAKMLNDHIPDWREYSALHGATKGWMDR